MAADLDIDTQLSEIQRSLRLLVKLKLAEIEGGRNQKEMILFLGSLGCTTNEISELMALPRTSVAPTLSRERGKKRGR